MLENQKQVTLRLDTKLWKQTKKRAIDLDLTVNNLIDKLIRKELGLPATWSYKSIDTENE